ncbi:SpvB/TcaC N-terminal domain-containing protein, partial [Chitinimonas viridis]
MTTTTAVGTSSTPGPVITVVSRGGALELSDNIAAGVGDAVAGLVALPDAGSLPGELGVSNGAATYSLPIAVPPGTAGMVPSISLNYSSQSGNGVAGLGWGLGGFSAIERCGKTLAQDGIAGAVRFDLEDRLCLDGQRLILVNLPANDANYWADNAEYRTEMESFSRITAQTANGKRSFKVQTKSGQVLYYGDSVDSYVEGQGRVDGRAHQWAIRRNEDISGNRVDYRYSENALTGEHLPIEVRWGNGTHAYNKVAFEYEGREDADVAYLAGSHTDRRQRLKRVHTWADTALDGSGGTPALSYVLDYRISASSGRSLLQQVSLIGSDGTRLPPTTFEWGGQDLVSASYVSKGTWSGGPTLPLRKNGATTEAGMPVDTDHLVNGDFNGDGKMDLLTPAGIYLSTGTDFRHLPYQWGAFPLNMRMIDGIPGRPVIGNFDGSHRKSMLDIRQAPSLEYFGKLCRIAADDTAVVCDAEFPLGRTPAMSMAFAVDTDGDGRDELLLAHTQHKTGEQRSDRCQVTAAGLSCQPYANVRDVAKPTAMDVEWWLKLSEGQQQSGLQYTGTAPHPMVTLGKAAGDIDGDGIADYYFENGTACLTKSTGFNCAFMSYMPGGEDIANEVPGARSPQLQQDAVSDWNADGYIDFLSYVKDASGNYTYSICYGTGQTGKLDCRTSGIHLPARHVVDLNGAKQPRAFVMQSRNGVGQELTPSSCSIMDGLAKCVDVNAPAGWSGPAEPAPGSSKHNYVVYGDFTGTGRQDIATYRGDVTPHWEIYSANAEPGIDRIVRVVQGSGKQEEVSYALPSDQATYQQQASDVAGLPVSNDYPKRLQAGTEQLVSRSRSSLGRGTWQEHSYRYAGAAYDLLGRGGLGMARVEVTNLHSQITSTQWFSQVWPTTGMVTADQTVTNNGTVLSKDSLLPASQALAQANGSSTIFAYVKQSTQTRRDLDGSPLGTTFTDNQYTDGWGNLTQSDVKVSHGGIDYYTQTRNTYRNINTTAVWRAGLLSTSSVSKADTSRTVNQTAITRNVAYSYDALGRLDTETVEPGDPAYQIITTHNRRSNPYGLVELKQQSWRNPATGLNETRTV